MDVDMLPNPVREGFEAARRLKQESVPLYA
jgi:hypothetical protein